jgi:putative membrane protein
VAFISGIYDELLHSLKSIDAEALRLLLTFKLSEFWKKINGRFLFTLLAGIVTSLVSLAKLMTYLLDTYPIEVWSFFFGLILVSAPLVLREVKKWSVGVVVAFVVGIIVAYFITILSPTTTTNALWFVFICGAVAICAMILPGISGAFVLLLIGKYEYMVNALIDVNIPVILVFVVGCAIGLISFSRFLSWILDHYHNATVGLLAGFMIGSLNKVWPWKIVTAYRLDSSGAQVPAFDKSVLPADYFSVTGNDPKILVAILMVALGACIIVVLEKVALRLKTKT